MAGEMKMSTVATPAGMDRREMEYVYQDGDGFVFLDTVAGVLATVPHEQVGSSWHYLKEGDHVHVLFHDGQPVTLEPATTVPLAVIDTAPPRKATGWKRALLETGLKITVPAFIDVGDTVLVDTREGAFLGRAD
jgi:elongation factor P